MLFYKKTDHDEYMIRFLFIIVLVYSSFSKAYDFFNEDFKNEHVYPFLKRAVDKPSLGLIVTGAAASFATREQDDQIRSEWKDHQKINSNDSHIGDLLGTGAGSLLVMAGQYFADEDQNNFKSHTRGFIYGGLSIYTLKTAFGRNRPGSSHSHQSFPSGHSAISFMTATNIAYAYGWPAGLVAYSIAGFVGATRLSDDAHWFSDVVGGAFLGIWVGRASFYQQTSLQASNIKDTQEQSQFIPIISADQVGAGWVYQF